MSDTFGPENEIRKIHGTEPDAFPHSGNLPDELREDHPTGAFDNTDLGDFDTSHLTAPLDPATLPEYMPSTDETALPPLEHQYSDPDTNSNQKNRWLKPAIAAGVLGVGGIALLLKGGSDNQTNTTTSPAPEQPTMSTDTTNAEPNITTTPDKPTKPNTGNVYLADILPGEDYITATTERGEEIHVPYLRSQGTPNELAVSALSLMSCYLTTGNEQCLDALTQREGVRDYLTTLRSTSYIGNSAPTQAVYYDKARNPVDFDLITDAEGYKKIILLSGSLYYEAHVGDVDWQSYDAINSDAQQYLIDPASFDLSFVEFSDGSLQLIRYGFDAE